MDIAFPARTSGPSPTTSDDNNTPEKPRFRRAFEEMLGEIQAIKYLRRSVGDADSIAPSLYTSHGIRKKKRAQSKLAEVQSPNAAEGTIHPNVTTPPESAIQASVAQLAVSNVAANDGARELVALHGPFVGPG